MAVHRLAGSSSDARHHGINGGRAAILLLLPFSLAETGKANLLHGGFPAGLARPRARSLWFASFLQTYLERDVRPITNIRDLVQKLKGHAARGPNPGAARRERD